MITVVATQITLTSIGAGRIVFQTSGTTGGNHGSIKIDQTGEPAAVGIVTDITRRIQAAHSAAHATSATNMLAVPGKTLIAQDTIPVMAFVTKGIGTGTFRRWIRGQVLAFQQARPI